MITAVWGALFCALSVWVRLGWAADWQALSREQVCRQLVESSAQYSCDKMDGDHLYDGIYCDLLAPLQASGRPVVMLEIGFGCGHHAGSEGSSALVWRRLFGARLKYFAIDLMPQGTPALQDACWLKFSTKHPGAADRLWFGDQANATLLREIQAELASKHGVRGLNLVIDDGSHFYHHIRASFQFLWPLVVAGGKYVIEDIQADHRVSRVVGKWVEKLAWGESALYANSSDTAFETEVPRGLKKIECAHQICVLQKAGAGERLPHKGAGHWVRDKRQVYEQRQRAFAKEITGQL